MKRSREEDTADASTPRSADAKKARLLHNPAGGGWDDLVDDAKKEIRRHCVPYVQRMLGMTCKAERALALAPSPSRFLIGLVKYDELRLLKCMGSAYVLATNDNFPTPCKIHNNIVHFAMRNASRDVVEWLVTGKNRWIPLIPCATCFRLCYERTWYGMDDALVAMLVRGCDNVDEIEQVLREEAEDDTFGAFMRRFH